MGPGKRPWFGAAARSCDLSAGVCAIVLSVRCFKSRLAVFKCCRLVVTRFFKCCYGVIDLLLRSFQLLLRSFQVLLRSYRLVVTELSTCCYGVIDFFVTKFSTVGTELLTGRYGVIDGLPSRQRYFDSCLEVSSLVWGFEFLKFGQLSWSWRSFEYLNFWRLGHLSWGFGALLHFSENFNFWAIFTVFTRILRSGRVFVFFLFSGVEPGIRTGNLRFFGILRGVWLHH